MPRTGTTREQVDARWTAAQELGAFNMSPWPLDPAAGETPQLYPAYDATARLLTAAGLPPDFESDGSVRYTHRTLPDREVYFVANRTDERVTAQCTFRVSERQAGTVGSVGWDNPPAARVPRGGRSNTDSAAVRALSELLRRVSCAGCRARGRHQRGEEFPGERAGRHHRRPLGCLVRQDSGRARAIGVRDTRGLESARITGGAPFLRDRHLSALV